MLTVEDFLTLVYCLVDDLLATLVRIHSHGRGLRAGRLEPKLSDSEVITMLVVGEFLGLDTDKDIWSYFRRHGRHHFPRLGHRTTFVRQATNLWWFVGALQHVLAKHLGALDDLVHVVDGFPIVVAGVARARRSRCFRGEAAHGHCAAKKQNFYGFRGHLVISFDGIITACSLTAANVDERQGVWDVLGDVVGHLLGDKGYLGRFFASLLYEEGIVLWTPVRKGMAPIEARPWTSEMGRVRRRGGKRRGGQGEVCARGGTRGAKGWRRREPARGEGTRGPGSAKAGRASGRGRAGDEHPRLIFLDLSAARARASAAGPAQVTRDPRLLRDRAAGVREAGRGRRRFARCADVARRAAALAAR